MSRARRGLLRHLHLEAAELPRTAPPARALWISLLSLLVAVSAAIFRFEGLDRYWGLLWVLALIPPFLLSFYRGWAGAVTALGLGMVALTVTELGGGWLLGAHIDWIVYAMASTALILVSLGLGISTELLHRSGGDPHMADLLRRTTQELEQALDGEFYELDLHYQPIIRSRDGQLEGAEALLRWRHPTRGFIGASEFIPLVERTRALGRLDRWILLTALRRLRDWTALEDPAWISVNLSPRSFEDHGLIRFLLEKLEEEEYEPGRLVIEVTESLALGKGRSVETLGRMREMGIRVAIDDFGTGHSALAYLKRLPADLLKLDQMFMERVEEERDAEVAQAIVRLGRALGLEVVVEGIESRAQYEWALRSGCDLLQGFYLGHPSPADELDSAISKAARYSPL